MDEQTAPGDRAQGKDDADQESGFEPADALEVTVPEELMGVSARVARFGSSLS